MREHVLSNVRRLLEPLSAHFARIRPFRAVDHLVPPESRALRVTLLAYGALELPHPRVVDQFVLLHGKLFREAFAANVAQELLGSVHLHMLVKVGQAPVFPPAALFGAREIFHVRMPPHVLHQRGLAAESFVALRAAKHVCGCRIVRPHMPDVRMAIGQLFVADVAFVFGRPFVQSHVGHQATFQAVAFAATVAGERLSWFAFGVFCVDDFHVSIDFPCVLKL